MARVNRTKVQEAKWRQDRLFVPFDPISIRISFANHDRLSCKVPLQLTDNMNFTTRPVFIFYFLRGAFNRAAVIAAVVLIQEPIAQLRTDSDISDEGKHK